MNCADVRHEFSAMLDGELTPETRAAVEVHLSECSECLRELDKLKRVDALYHALPRQHAPDGFEERVSASLKPAVIQFRRQERRFATRRLWPLMAAAAAMLVILGGVLLQLETKQESFDIASNPEAVAEQDAEDMPEHIKQQLRALGYLEDDTDLEGDASDELAKPVREITQPMGNMPQKNSGDLGRENKLDDSGTVSGVKKTEEKQRFWADSDHAPPEPAKPTEPMLAEAPSPAQSSSAAADVPRIAKEEMESSSLPMAEASGLVAAPAEKDYRAREMAEPVEAKAKAKAVLMDTIASTQTPMAEAEQEPKPSPPKTPLSPPPASSSVRKSLSPAAPASMLRSKRMDKMESEEGVSAPDLAEKRLRKEQTVGSRSFELREDIWTEKGYEGEETITLYKNSEPLRQLTERHAGLSKIATLGERVIFRWEGKWYQIEPTPAHPSETKE